MTAHLSPEQIHAYQEKRLHPEDLPEIVAHLAECSSCRQRLIPTVRLGEVAGALQSAPRADEHATEHLSFTQLADHLDDRLDEVDREIVEGHLELCAACTAEWEDLRTFRTTVTMHPSQEVAPAKRAAFWSRAQQKWREFFPSGTFPSGTLPSGTLRLGTLRPGTLRMAWAVGVAAFLILAIVLPIWRVQARSWRQEKAELSQENAVLKHQVAAQGAADPHVKELWGVQQQRDQARKEAADAQTQRSRLQERVAKLEREQSKSPFEAGTASVALNDGAARLLKDRSGRLIRMQVLPSAAVAALNGAPLSIPASARALAREQGMLMGAPDDKERFAVISPVATFVLSARPTFSWTPLKGATRYQVVITQDHPGGEPTLVRRSALVTETHWQPSTPLPRSTKLTWQVLAFQENEQVDAAPKPPLAEASFQALKAQQAEEIARAQTQYADSPFTLGVLYAQAGLLQEAAQQFDRLAKSNPRSNQVYKWQQEVRRLRQK